MVLRSRPNSVDNPLMDQSVRVMAMGSSCYGGSCHKRQFLTAGPGGGAPAQQATWETVPSDGAGWRSRPCVLIGVVCFMAHILGHGRSAWPAPGIHPEKAAGSQAV